MTGGPGAILITPAVSRRTCGIVSITGGSTGLFVYVGGVPWGGTVLLKGGNDTGAPTTYESMNPPTITSQTLGRWTLNLDLFDTTGNFAPARGSSIVLTEGGMKLFAGCIQSVGRQRTSLASATGGWSRRTRTPQAVRFRRPSWTLWGPALTGRESPTPEPAFRQHSGISWRI
jgi:hypothetical protein